MAGHMVRGTAWTVVGGLVLVFLFYLVSTPGSGRSLKHLADVDGSAAAGWQVRYEQEVAKVAALLAKIDHNAETVTPVEVIPEGFKAVEVATPLVGECDMDCVVKRHLGYFAARAPLTRANIPPFDRSKFSLEIVFAFHQGKLYVPDVLGEARNIAKFYRGMLFNMQMEWAARNLSVPDCIFGIELWDVSKQFEFSPYLFLASSRKRGVSPAVPWSNFGFAYSFRWVAGAKGEMDKAVGYGTQMKWEDRRDKVTYRAGMMNGTPDPTKMSNETLNDTYVPLDFAPRPYPSLSLPASHSITTELCSLSTLQVPTEVLAASPGALRCGIQ